METYMENNMPLKTIEPMSEDFIAEHNIELFDTWIIRDEAGQSWGPFHTNDLKDIAQEHEELFEEYTALNLATEKEKPFFQNTKFQRRKPKLVSLQGLQTIDNFYLLDQGVKKGPFTLEHIKELLDSKKMTLNILASVDKGQSWIKLFEHHEFDRRLLKNKEELPFSPNAEVLDKKFDKMEKSYKKPKEEQEALVGLAFIGGGNDKGQKIVTPPTGEQATAQTEKVSNPKVKYVAAAAVFVLVLFTGINSFNSSYVKDVTSPNIRTAERVKKLKEIKVNTVAKRTPAKTLKAKRYRPLKRKSISSSKRKRRNYRELNNNQRHETVDLEDSFNKEEISRGIASQGNDDLSDEEIEFIERAERGEFNEDEAERRKGYLEDKRDQYDEY
jgi:hypothetical protein